MSTSFSSEVEPVRRKGGFRRLGWDLALLVFVAAILLLLIYLNLSFLAWLRLVLGVLYVLVAPGYALQAALFPRQDDLDGIERTGLALGLSIGVNPLLALILDALPWGLRLWPMAISLALTVLVFSLIALARRLFLPPQERFTPGLSLNLKGWWISQERFNQRLYRLVAGALLVALLSVAAILLLPKPSEHFSEFYILGPEGQAQDYPREVTAGQAVRLNVGITNQEGVVAIYQIKIKTGGQVLTQTGPVTLENGKSWQKALEFSMPTAGDDQQVLLVLEREGQPSPYRSLQLWINVKPSAAP